MLKYPELVVLRHGQTDWNKLGRHQGRLDSPLTELGIRQAKQQGQQLQNLSVDLSGWRMVCSPQGRARRTAQIALSEIGATAQTDDRLREIAFGDWQGLTFDQIADGWPEHCKYADQDMFSWNFQSPGGESFDDICDRVQGFLAELKQPTVIITHGITSRILRGLWLGLGQYEMSGLGGGQGCVYHLKDAEQTRYPAE